MDHRLHQYTPQQQKQQHIIDIYGPSAGPAAHATAVHAYQQQQQLFVYPHPAAHIYAQTHQAHMQAATSGKGLIGQFSTIGPTGTPVPVTHPQQQHLQQFYMQQAMFQSAMAQQQQQQSYPSSPSSTQQQSSSQPTTEASSPNGKRVQQSKADRRAEHNAIERTRRENLNSRFQQLAHVLPNLQNDRRPSKSTIIERTLDYVRDTRSKQERFEHQIHLLLKDNERLKRHLKKYRREQRQQQQQQQHLHQQQYAAVADCGSVSSSGDEDSYLVAAVLGAPMPQHHYQHHPSPSMMMMMTQPSTPIATAAAAAAASSSSAPWEHLQYITQLPSSTSYGVLSPVGGGTISCSDDEDDSDSASFTQPIDTTPYQSHQSHPMMSASAPNASVVAGSGGGGGGYGSAGDYMTEPIAGYHSYVKMEPSQQHP